MTVKEDVIIDTKEQFSKLSKLLKFALKVRRFEKILKLFEKKISLSRRTI